MNATSAEENLRVIRGLMERATIYRAISFPAAGFAGILAMGVGICMAISKSKVSFYAVWLGVLAICSIINFYFLWKGANKRGEKFLSSGMALAFRCMAPLLLVSGVFTIAILRIGDFPNNAVTIWLITYGLLLLAMQTFAPISLIWLGWLFLITGVGVGFSNLIWDDSSMYSGSHFVMAFTFGLYHLVYAGVGYLKSKAP